MYRCCALRGEAIIACVDMDRTLALYRLVAGLPKHDWSFVRSTLPSNGIYFFFEKAERVVIDGQAADRIVRVGTIVGRGAFRSA
jgi:hypothetical protein